MPTYVPPLRGVDVGGRGLVPMVGLRELLESLGLRNVRTLIQSGNAVRALDPERFLPDRFAVVGTEIHLHLPGGLGRSKLPPHLDRRLGVPVTRRNWSTVTGLLDLASS